MSRTSKKTNTAAGIPGKAAEKKTYSVGIYARLSVDGGGKNESVETQIEIAKAYVREQQNMVIFDCYTDIGKSGTNFRREGFERMMHDVRMHRIDCIIVKDLSRFGRNHIETGNYIEKIFPFLGVRFIAVTDCFDSMKRPEQNEEFSINLKNLINEMYARDIAVKVKASRTEKRIQGGYTGGNPPYGYRAEWTEGKKYLLTEEETSDIVKKIFELFVSGKTIKEIVAWLYEKRIVRPSEYHRTGQIFCPRDRELLQWPKSTVKKILTNSVYTGKQVQSREAIIGDELFLQAADKFQKSSDACRRAFFSKTAPPEEDIFADVLYCGACGVKMRRIASIRTDTSKGRSRTYSYHCPRRDRIDEQKCTTKSISLSALSHIVKEAIRQEFSLSEMRPKDLTEAGQREAEKSKREWERQLVRLDGNIRELKRHQSELYRKYRMEELSENAFYRLQEESSRSLAAVQKKRADLFEKLNSSDAQTARRNHFLRALVRGDDRIVLTAEVVRTLVHRIEIYPDDRVRVIFAFRKNLPGGGIKI